MEWIDLLDFALKVILAAFTAGIAVWKIIEGKITTLVDTECTARKTADSNIENQVFSNNQNIHNYMGKVDLLKEQLDKEGKTRMEEMYDLRDSIRDGLHKIEIQIERLRQENNQSKKE